GGRHLPPDTPGEPVIMPLTSALIAIVDDEEGVRVALQRLCHAYGAETLGFPSVAQLLAALADRRPDCVIVDAHIPGPNGPELREKLRARAGTIPTIVITGRDDDAAEVRALAAGARAC